MSNTLDPTELQDLRRRIVNSYDYTREEVKDAIATLRHQRAQARSTQGNGNSKKSSGPQKIDLSDLME